MRIENRFDQVDKRFDQVNKRFDHLESRIEKLDARIDSNFKWIIGFIVLVFLGLLAIIAHGFKWI